MEQQITLQSCSPPPEIVSSLLCASCAFVSWIVPSCCWCVSSTAKSSLPLHGTFRFSWGNSVSHDMKKEACYSSLLFVRFRLLGWWKRTLIGFLSGMLCVLLVGMERWEVKVGAWRVLRPANHPHSVWSYLAPRHSSVQFVSIYIPRRRVATAFTVFVRA